MSENGKLNENLDKDFNDNTVGSFLHPEVFNKLNDDLKSKVIETYSANQKDINNKKRGKLASLLGSNSKNIPLYIAFVICILLIIIGVQFQFIPEEKRDDTVIEFWKLIFPIITSILGFIFGKSVDNSNNG